MATPPINPPSFTMKDVMDYNNVLMVMPNLPHGTGLYFKDLARQIFTTTPGDDMTIPYPKPAWPFALPAIAVKAAKPIDTWEHKDDSCHKFAADDQAMREWETKDDIEKLPGYYKSFRFSYPTTVYRQITIQGRDLQEALRKADKSLKGRVAKGSAVHGRTGAFRVERVWFTNVKKALHSFGHRIRKGQPAIDPTRTYGNLDNDNKNFSIEVAKSIEVPDEYFI